MRQLRKNLESALVVAASERIQKAVLSMPEYQAASTVGCYMALPYEVQTRGIILDCWNAEKKVCVPTFNEQLSRYELTWLQPHDEIRPGRHNIEEPAAETRAGMMEVDFIVVPALAYDRSGGRLGHGGGHFDRVLGNWSGLKVGVAFEFQVFDKVPMGAQDIPVDVVVTEKTIYRGT